MANNLPILDGTGASTAVATVETAGVHTPKHIVVNESGVEAALDADGRASVITQNISNKFRETFEAWPSAEWDETKAAGDIVVVDGNALGASYLVLSMDPLTAGTDTYVDTVQSFKMPTEMAVGLHASQAMWGHDLSVEFIDRDFITPVPADLAIASISQATTTLTVDTVLPHNLAVGKRIGIRDCSDARLNFPSVVIASVLSPTSFTVTGGPNGAITSLTISNPAGAKGFVHSRPALSNSRNGTSLHFESATATLGFSYARASAGDVLPFSSGSGNALTGRQATSFGTTASVALAAAPYTYSFAPSNEYRLTLMADRLQWSDISVDSLAGSSNRVLRSQVVPNPAKDYFLRIRARTEPSTTIPVGQIVSVSKAGSTTATVTMAGNHGLVTGDLVVGYGVRDIATGFYPALTTAAAVTVTGATTFTVVWGTSATNTSFGGYISKVNAGCPQPGALSMSIQSAVKTTLADGQHQVVLVGSATWAGAVIGDYVNVVGCRDAVTGTTTIGIDGAWKIANIATSTLTLVNIPGNSPTVTDFALVNCGGGVIKRTDVRVSYVRLFEFERERVELLPRPAGDISGSVPVTLTGGTLTTVTTVTGVTTVAAITSANLGIPGTIADVAGAALTTTATVAAITPTFGTSYQVNIPVTAVAGTNPTMDVTIEESDDSGTNWFKVYDFPRITATGMYRSPVIPLTGNRVRYVQTIGGTGSPSFTRAINRLQSSIPALPVRQLIDRAINVNSGNPSTASLVTADCGNRLQLVVNMGAITTTAPAFQLQGSDDGGIGWYNIGSPLTGVASSTVQLTVADVNAALTRVNVSTTGSGATLNSLTLKAHD